MATVIEMLVPKILDGSQTFNFEDTKHTSEMIQSVVRMLGYNLRWSSITTARHSD